MKTRVLVLLSDGRPLDGEYKDEYALEDTKAALREAKREGSILIVSPLTVKPTVTSAACMVKWSTP